MPLDPEPASSLKLRHASLFLLLSGAAALIYQVAWVRLLGMSVGASHEAVATVVAAFFFGMAVGSLLAARWTARGADLQLYVVLEVVLGASAMAVFWALTHLDQLMAHAPALGSSTFLRFALAFAVLSIPTICMGATFPVIVAICVRGDSRLSERIGSLYAINTCGAVAGALLCGFVFLPRFGLGGSIHIAVALNFLIALVAYFMSNAPGPAVDDAPSPPAATGARGKALAVLSCTGFAAIAAELGWTRALSIFTGTTVYGFSAILAAFLVGIALGSWTIGRRLESWGRPTRVLAGGLVALGAALLVTRAGLALIPGLHTWADGLDLSFGARNWVKYGAVFVILLPSTLCFGSLFPVSVRLYCGDAVAVGPAVGRAYAVNTVAGIAGSLAAGFWLIPALGTDGLLLGVVMVVLATAVALTASPFDRGQAMRVAPAALLLAACSPFLPGVDVGKLVEAVRYRRDLGPQQRAQERVLFLKEGRTGVISAVTRDEKMADLANNGLQEATINLENPRLGPVVEGLLGLLPYFLHEDPKTAFVVGFGGGTTVQALTMTDLTAVRVVELEPLIVEAVRSLHDGDVPCLQDPRLTLTINDARNTLIVEKTSYDIIASQPSHPWIAGAGNLFTREFFTIVRSRLNPGGIYCQWVNLFRMESLTLTSIVRTFYEVFPEGFVCLNAATSDMFMIGSERRPQLQRDRFNSAVMDDAYLEAYLKENGIEVLGDLLIFYFASRDQALRMSDGAPINTDHNLLSELRLARLKRDMTAEESPKDLLDEFYTLDFFPYVSEDDRPRTVLEFGRACLRMGATNTATVVLKLLEQAAMHGPANQLRREIFEFNIPEEG